MAHMNNILDRLDAIEIHTENGLPFITYGDDESDYFDNQRAAEQYISHIKAVKTCLDKLVGFENNGYLRMVDNYGNQVSVADICMDIDTNLWMKNNRYVEFLGVSSEEAIRAWLNAVDTLWENTTDNTIFPLEDSEQDEIFLHHRGGKLNCSAVVVQREDDDFGFMRHIKNDFIWEAVFQALGVKSAN